MKPLDGSWPTVDAKKLEYGCRVIYADVPSVFGFCRKLLFPKWVNVYRDPYSNLNHNIGNRTIAI